MSTQTLSADAQAIALVCALLEARGAGAAKPFTPGEWHDLTLALRRSPLERPGDLLGLRAAQLENALRIAPDDARRLHSLLGRGGQLAFEVQRLAERGIWLLTRADDAYPRQLKDRLRGQAPPLLYGAGLHERLHTASIAVVGSRDVSEEGLDFARTFGQRCAQREIAVVSGAARGVDSAAMDGALQGGGTAIGVTVDPLERLVRRQDLRIALGDGTLALITPFHPSARWHAGNAMRRNRLIYAMSRAAVVVATAEGSGGTWAGAEENLKHRWVPLFVRDDGSPGARAIRQRGGIALSADAAEVDPRDLLDAPSAAPTLLDGLHDTPIVGRAADAGTAAADEAAAGDVYELVWPVVAHFLLSQPRGERAVAEHLGLEIGQARAWLKRAVAEGRVLVDERPVRYRAARASDGG